METTVAEQTPKIAGLPVATTDALFKAYEDIIRSWGYIGQISSLVLCDTMLSFIYEGNPVFCPAEPQSIHKTRVQIAAQVEELIAARSASV